MNNSDPLKISSRQISDPHSSVQEYFIRIERVAKKRAIAIVLDFSESCEVVEILGDGFAKSLRSFDPNHMLWIFALSFPTVLNDPKRDRIEDLASGAVSLDRWFTDKQLRETCLCAGTFFRPIVDSISDMKGSMGVDYIDVFILTDGELLDLEATTLPEDVRVLGICESTPSGLWNWVLPHSPIARWNALSTGVHEIFHPLRSDSYKISVEVNGQRRPDFTTLVSLLDETKTRSHSIDFPSDSRQMDMRLEFVDINKCDVGIVIHDKQSKPVFSKSLIHTEALEKNLIPQFLKAVEITRDTFHFLRDIPVSSGEVTARLLTCIDGIIRSESRFMSEPLLNSLFELTALDLNEVDAFLLVFSQDHDQSRCRLLLFGLNEIRNPSFQVAGGVSTPWGVFSENLKIYFDKLESRWIVQSGCNSKQLIPTQSCRIPVSVEDTSCKATVIFVSKR